MERKIVIPLLSLASASITFTANYDHEFDQAGLAIILQSPASLRSKWIKLGVENFGGRPRLSVSCCDNWADWCMASLPSSTAALVAGGKQSLTFSVEKKKGALWVYHDSEHGERLPIREITWVYGLDDPEHWIADLAAYAARPSIDATSSLEVSFERFEIQTDQAQSQ